MEAFACGVPVICSLIGGIPELVNDDETGFLFNPGDVIGLRDKIKAAVDDREGVERMGREARRIAEEKYDPEVHYNALVKIYQDVLAKEKK